MSGAGERARSDADGSVPGGGRNRHTFRELRVMPYFMVDVEADGPIPGDYSMVSLGAGIVEPGLERTFYGRLKPISERFIPEALAVSGHSRQETLAFDDPAEVMGEFRDWVNANARGRALFVSDNNGFDWMFV